MITRFGDHARTSAKLRKAGNEAAAFWVWANMWSNENDTGGFLDAELLGDIPPVAIQQSKAVALANKCVGAVVKRGGMGLFEKVEGGYQIHDFGDFRPSHMIDPVLSEKRRQAGLAGLAKRYGKPATADGNLLSVASNESSNLLSVAESESGNPTHTRACARVQVQVSEISEARRDPDPNSQRASPPEDATPEAAQAALSEPPLPETSYDLAKRVWAELWAGRYRRPYAFTTNLNPKGEHGVLRWLGDLARERGGADAERWVRHYVSTYLREHGKAEEQCHPLRWIESAVNSAGEPKRLQPKGPARSRDPPLRPLHVDPREASAKFREAFAKGEVPGAIGNGGSK